MKRVGIVLNRERPNALKVFNELKDWLRQRGLEVLDDLASPREEIPKRSDLLIALGGDGTLLNLAKSMGEGSPPVVGVNLGGLGFLTETTLDELYQTLERVLKGDYEISERMMIEAEVVGGDEKFLALNDLVISREATSRILNLVVRINGEEVLSYAGDGLIISSPTGSTAHALSAGGPIVHPAVEGLILIPICPHTLASRPLVSPKDLQISISFGPEAKKIVLAVDGQRWVELVPEDVVKVATSSIRLKLVPSLERSYWQILREKLKL